VGNEPRRAKADRAIEGGEIKRDNDPFVRCLYIKLRRMNQQKLLERLNHNKNNDNDQ
jgi:hypothetical protein